MNRSTKCSLRIISKDFNTYKHSPYPQFESFGKACAVDVLWKLSAGNQDAEDSVLNQIKLFTFNLSTFCPRLNSAWYCIRWDGEARWRQPAVLKGSWLWNEAKKLMFVNDLVGDHDLNKSTFYKIVVVVEGSSMKKLRMKVGELKEWFASNVITENVSFRKIACCH